MLYISVITTFGLSGCEKFLSDQLDHWTMWKRSKQLKSMYQQDIHTCRLNDDT